MKGDKSNETACPHCGGMVKVTMEACDSEAKEEKKEESQSKPKGKSPGVAAVLAYKKP